MQNEYYIERTQSPFVLWILAFQFCFQYICAMLGFSGASIILSFALIGISLYELIRGRMKIPVAYLIILFCVMVVFILSMFFLVDDTATRDYFMRFMLYEAIALLLGYQVEDKEGIISRVVVIGVVLLPFLLRSNVMDRETSRQMGFAYSCLPVLIASIFGLTYGKKIAILSTINIVAIILGFSSYAPRGVWLVIGTVLCLCFYWHFCKSNSKKSSRIGGIALLTFFIIAVSFLLNNFEWLVVSVNDFLINKLNIKIYALQKFVLYLGKENVLNGRENLWIQAREVISRNPFTGNGIGYYESINNGAYCHNILLEAFCEAGLFFVIPIILYIGTVLVRLLNSPYAEEKVGFQWLALTFCVGIEPLFLSSSYWMYTPFWFFLGAFLRESKQKKLNRRNI